MSGPIISKQSQYPKSYLSHLGKGSHRRARFLNPYCFPGAQGSVKSNTVISRLCPNSPLALLPRRASLPTHMAPAFEKTKSFIVRLTGKEVGGKAQIHSLTEVEFKGFQHRSFLNNRPVTSESVVAFLSLSLSLSQFGSRCNLEHSLARASAA